MTNLDGRVRRLETAVQRSVHPLPTILPATCTDAELEALHRRGVEAYRAGSDELLEALAPEEAGNELA